MEGECSKVGIHEYTEKEFLEFISSLFLADVSGTDDEADALFMHFNNICPHPAGSDLIYYPESGADSSAEGIAKAIGEWCRTHGIPGFRQE
ncbi:bacteriocin immunity protein [Pseudomonas knackmussii]|uniref:bacteriocin immunity protein n=1 Tax=Pseudomonas knackmussii TaxID=65741 RepID=UPI003BD2FC84